MKVLQEKMHQSLLADNLLGQIVAERNTDVSKQYRDCNDGQWYKGYLGTAAIWLLSQKDTSVYSFGADSGFVWVKVGGVTYVRLLHRQ